LRDVLKRIAREAERLGMDVETGATHQGWLLIGSLICD
jgi:hypothetical protein